MIRLALKLSVAAAAIWALWTFVPVHGRTLADRWRASGDVLTFLERAGAEISGKPAPRARPPARGQGSADARGRPSESHTEADREAVDKLLSERLSGRR